MKKRIRNGVSNILVLLSDMAANGSKKPKVLIVTGVLWVGGGAEKVAANLGNYLTDQGYETHLLTFYEAPQKYPYHGIYHTFNEQPKTRLQKVFQVPVRIWKIARYARRHKITVAYTFLEEANFYTLVAKLLFRRRLPVIVSVRNNLNQRGRLFRWLSKKLYPHAQAVVSVTRAVEHMLQVDYGLHNTTTIYNSLDMEHVERQVGQPLPAAYQWLSDAQPLIITIGRLIQQKGQWHLIRAFSAVQQAHPDATLVILGEGEYRERLQQLVDDCGLSERVHFIGKHENVYQFLASADVFAFSSLWEGMPNTMLEALSVGLPIVSTDCVSGPREIIAPEVGTIESIHYPHGSPYGILTPVPDNAPPIWQAPAVQPLIPEEVELAAALKQVLDERWFRGPAHTEYRRRIATAFDKKTIMQQWEALLPPQP